MWSDYQNLSHTAHKEVIPWNWNVQAAGNADVQCYPTSAVLGSFALVVCHPLNLDMSPNYGVAW